MIKWRKIRSFFQLNTRMKLLIIEAFLTLAWARLKKSKDFANVASALGKHMNETGFHANDENKEILHLISRAIHLVSPYTFWESECLVKAIAGMKMLERREIESTLYLGMAKDETGLIAHAWLRSGTFYISGSEGMERFTVVAKFAKSIKSKGENYEEQT
ncbi:lasso peptide biosynthesis B2 protein [Psychrobacillus sp. NPDC096426]|uniref:lasso peptide biosynthesis B2 protein n=1 Tax=Psychrobacillus sp. NPDC096426 TaxID=3364491 RepID=UPI00380593DB